jgi:phage shock protein PspC (stress-responsive transcriptional regulator)/predicted membrane protein
LVPLEEVSVVRQINGSDVQSTLREMWETRPARRSDDRQVAGVAAAIARRYDIDPTLVRIAFVVAALSGIGAALYIAGWIALPSAPDAHGVASRPRRGIIVVGLIAAVLATFGWWNDGPGAPPVVLGVVALGLLYLLHRSRSDRSLEAPTVVTAAPVTGLSLRKDEPRTDEPVVHAAPAPDPLVPPAWDPLGAAPFAWDLPEPAPAAPPPPRRKLPVTSVTLGVGLLATGVTAVILLLAGSLTFTNAPVLLGVLLSVVGLGLVVGSFLKAGRGLIPVALLLSALVWGVLEAPVDRLPEGGVGELHVTPLSVAQVQPVYQRGAGDLEIDLSELDLSVPAGTAATPVRTRIELGLGDVQVTVPEDADITVNGEVSFGELTVGERNESGSELRIRTNDLGEDGMASGRPIELDIMVGAGNVEVRRD